MARPRTEEAEAFYIAVYETVQRIPLGRVTTYGHIALLIHAPQNSRQVGSALKYLRHGPPATNETVPWWRVISADGRIAFRARGAMDEQSERLQAEGVDVRNDAHSRPRSINLREYGWFPRPEDDDSD
ncbi:Alkyltransferase [Lipomyces orientalis]|uniref:Alkyltransferase n=1 Tax=Lipomyces orientalis TaxID=1233043 RepID=A0ACC3TS55_9ASCO